MSNVSHSNTTICSWNAVKMVLVWHETNTFLKRLKWYMHIETIFLRFHFHASRDFCCKCLYDI